MESNEPKVIYAFTAKGLLPNGGKFRAFGRVQAEDGYPWSAFEAAADVVEKQSGHRPDTSKGGVTLRRLKKQPRS
ncbi:MAG: hypothetical protein IT581_06515 [Verrucomicrobiales bacterium]|nr:hypothetical protein [Verrucomicrobiales bacterium]